MAKNLVAGGADVNVANHQGQTPLMVAVGEPKVARYLVKMGADVNAADRAGQTPLMYADEKGQAGVAAWLEKNGASE